MDTINQVLECGSCIKQEEDDKPLESSCTDRQWTQMEAAVKEEPPDSYLESLQELEFIPVKEERNPELPFLIGETEVDGTVSKTSVDDSIADGIVSKTIIDGTDDLSSLVPPNNKPTKPTFADDSIADGTVSKTIADDSIDNKVKEDGETCPSVNGVRDLNGDSDRSLQGKNEHESAGGTPKAARKRRGRKPRYNRHISDKPFQCKICQKCFRKPEHLRCHQLFHSDKRQYLCDTCGKGFYTSGDLKRHRVVHTGEKPYACPMCPKTFTQLCNMQSHLRKRCLIKGYGCDLCNKMFEDQEHLEKHRANHGTKPRYVNNVRRKPFCQDLPPFICDMCSLCFSNKRNLISHIKEHMGKIGIVYCTCEICGKICDKRTRLIVHMRSHTGEKPFSCNVCGRAFSQQCNLKKHEALHLPD